jgi:hypothetical protein
MVPIGDVSVMPHACDTRTPEVIRRSIIARGAADPPIVTKRTERDQVKMVRMEKIVLANGDTLRANASANSSITTTVSYVGM